MKFIKSPYLSFAVNLVYAVANSAFGLHYRSNWFLVMGAYYTVLATTRFAVLKIRQKNQPSHSLERFAKRFSGMMLTLLSFCLIGINILSAIKDRGTRFHEIIMITIALYTFVKITLAVLGLSRTVKKADAVSATLCNISFAEAVVSLYALQRSMLVSFPGMEPQEIQRFNVLTGSAVWLVVLLLGLNLIGGKYIDVAKSKIAKANDKVAHTVCKGYKKLEDGVVKGYQAVEKGAVSAYTKIEDKFVETYLAKDGETVEEAKKRLKKEEK